MRCANLLLVFTWTIVSHAQVMPELPLEFLSVCYPSTANTITVCSSGCDYLNGQLQMAINNAEPGTTILLQAGHTYPASITLPAKTGDEWIVIRTNVPDAQLPPADQRIDPSYAGALARFQAPANQSALTFLSGAHHYYLMGLEVASTGYTSDIIRIGDGTQNTLSALPHDIVLDRVYIHGDAALGTKRGIMLNSARTAVINCHISDCKSTSQDAQAICGWNGPGPFKLVNNHLEGSGENVMFGGANPAIQDLVPADIEVRNNHFFKPRSWQEGHSDYAGTPWCVKNIFELKNAQRVLVEGNILENNWADCQNGFAVLITPRTQSGASMWSRVTDVTWRYNILTGSDGGYNFSGHDDQLDNPVSTRILVEHNLAYDISNVNKMYQFLNGTEHLTIRHNTSLNAGTTTSAGGDPTLFLTFQDNIAGFGNYGVCGTGSGCGNPTINTYFPGSTFSHNVLFGTPGGPNGNPASYPPNHWFPAGIAPVGFVDAANDNYALLPTSPYYSTASDGTSIGADIDSLNSYTANVLPGVWTSCADISTQLNGAEAAMFFILTPNPARDRLTVLTSGPMHGCTIALFDAAGRIVLQQQLGTSGTTIDIGALRNGLLLAQFSRKDGSIVGVQRLVVLR
ncbi:MAG: T9SS type A sorting domain-containing protein [Flavobacteriales bacterium]|nr:T9SS type A sorting domain-containing protein [Flavobacteriales bacterium]